MFLCTPKICRTNSGLILIRFVMTLWSDEWSNSAKNRDTCNGSDPDLDRTVYYKLNDSQNYGCYIGSSKRT